MNFKPLSNMLINNSQSSNMLAAKATEIETSVGGKWVHDAKDSDKPIKAMY